MSLGKESAGVLRPGFSMNDLEPGAVWELADGCHVDIVDRAFIYGGKRWVAVDSGESLGPVLVEVKRFLGAREWSRHDLSREKR